MGSSQSREGLEIFDSDEEEESPASFERPSETVTSLDEVDAKLKSLRLKYSSSLSPGCPNSHSNINLSRSVKLFIHVGGSSTKSGWTISEKRTTYSFVKSSTNDSDDDSDGSGDDCVASDSWILKVGSKVCVTVDQAMQLKLFGEQRRVDFVCNGVWAMKFFRDEDYHDFVAEYHKCLFENTYGVESTEENMIKVYGKDFIGWVKPEVADDSIWEDAEEDFEKNPRLVTPVRGGQDLMEEFEEVADDEGIQSLALGALDNSFLVSNSGIQVVKNFSHGIQGKGVSVKFEKGCMSTGSKFGFSTPKKALLLRAETNMLLMNPSDQGRPHSMGVHQLDIETGKVVTEWRFEKDGTDITMRDITNDNKGSQLDPSESTFLGLDDNRLCRWDMREQKGIVQEMAYANTPVLHWTQGHQFSRGTNFQCFATTGDGSIVVGSLDGKIRLYSTSSMRTAKTAFPGLGSPITHVDVTFDGKWILGTMDSYLILISTLFTDKDGRTKTGFSGRMGNRLAAPRLLKLTPMDSYLAGANKKFHKGQFSWVTENGKQERHLVASIGKFSIVWNFQQVKNSNHECYQNQTGLKSCYCYKIVPKEESIIESRFMHDKFAVSDSPEAPLVVATPMKVSSFSISRRR